MKKLLLFLIFIIYFIFNSFCGYEIRGVYINYIPELKNYTLTFDENGVPIAAASMSTTGSSTVKNAIVIVRSGSNTVTTVFTIVLPYESLLGSNIEVRDFHYVASTGKYILCGSRAESAFLAEINSTLTTMRFIECPEANVYYSVLANFPTNIPNPLGYYVCGVSNSRGVICSIDPSTMLYTNFYTTNITPWEYNKIITKRTGSGSVSIVVSGRGGTDITGYTRLGFTVMNTLFGGMVSYMWQQSSETASHSVIADYYSDNTTTILASTYQNRISFHTININFPSTISANHFISSSSLDRFYIQDIGINPYIHVQYPRISVAGYFRGVSQQHAWYGFLPGTWNVLENVFYSEPIENMFRHYKIRYNQQGSEYTGGYFQSHEEKAVLFGSPINTTETCDIEDSINISSTDPITCSPFTLSPRPYPHNYVFSFNWQPYPMLFSHLCDVLKGSDYTSEFALPAPEIESEITNFYDRITVKDIPTGTNYQIFSVTGQLIQTGTTNPEIYTAQLAKGMYILRLETGKAFKFVK